MTMLLLLLFPPSCDETLSDERVRGSSSSSGRIFGRKKEALDNKKGKQKRKEIVFFVVDDVFSTKKKKGLVTSSILRSSRIRSRPSLCVLPRQSAVFCSPFGHARASSRSPRSPAGAKARRGERNEKELVLEKEEKNDSRHSIKAPSHLLPWCSLPSLFFFLFLFFFSPLFPHSPNSPATRSKTTTQKIKQRDQPRGPDDRAHHRRQRPRVLRQVRCAVGLQGVELVQRGRLRRRRAEGDVRPEDLGRRRSRRGVGLRRRARAAVEEQHRLRHPGFQRRRARLPGQQPDRLRRRRSCSSSSAGGRRQRPQLPRMHQKELAWAGGDSVHRLREDGRGRCVSAFSKEKKVARKKVKTTFSFSSFSVFSTPIPSFFSPLSLPPLPTPPPVQSIIKTGNHGSPYIRSPEQCAKECAGKTKGGLTANAFTFCNDKSG